LAFLVLFEEINALKMQIKQHQYYQIPNAYCLDLQRTSKSQGIERKGLSPNSLLNLKY
jgi:hypothetical protein